MARLDPEPAIMLMHDYDNLNPATQAWAGKTVGSWMYWGWDQLNTAWNTYSWTTVENYLATAAGYGKKVALSVMLYEDIGSDATPTWVYDELTSIYGATTAGWPILPAAANTFPRWNDTYWDTYYAKFVNDFAVRWDGDSRIHSIWICTARYGETVTTDMGTDLRNPMRFFKNSVAWYTGTPTDKYGNPVETVGFQTTPVFLIHSQADTRKQLAEFCFLRGVHSKMNVLTRDAQNHRYNPVSGAPTQAGVVETAYYVTQDNKMWMAYEHG